MIDLFEILIMFDLYKSPWHLLFIFLSCFHFEGAVEDNADVRLLGHVIGTEYAELYLCDLLADICLVVLFLHHRSSGGGQRREREREREGVVTEGYLVESYICEKDVTGENLLYFIVMPNGVDKLDVVYNYYI